MSVIRQDAWSDDDDLILAEVVLRHIREGSTQLAAFEEVGDRLSRTSAACGFRWNSTIRKKYESAIALAKKQRSGKRKPKTNEVDRQGWQEEQSTELVLIDKETEHTSVIEEVKTSEPLTMERVLDFLENYYKEQQCKVDEQLVKKLEEENKFLRKELEKEREKNQGIAEDYKTLVSIMDRARQMTMQDQSTNS